MSQVRYPHNDTTDRVVGNAGWKVPGLWSLGYNDARLGHDDYEDSMIIDQISQELLKKYLEYEDAVGRLAVLYNLPNDVVREKLQSYVKARPISWRQAVELAMIEGSDIQKELANAQRQRSQR